jgi:dephospho-CoA kinase
MLLLGVTGGLASGKSLVMRMLQERGATTFSADEAARAVLAPHGNVLKQIASAFGPEALTPEGTLDRTWLGRRIFTDEAARRRLNRIMHPAILRLLRAQIEAAQEDLPASTLVAVEVPLLFETNLQRWFELILVVSASETTQIARLHARDGLSEAEARQRLEAQWPMGEKVARADLVVPNDSSPEALQAAVEVVWKQLQSANVAE